MAGAIFSIIGGACLSAYTLLLVPKEWSLLRKAFAYTILIVGVAATVQGAYLAHPR